MMRTAPIRNGFMLTLAAFALALAAPAALHADTLYVPSGYPTIQAAVYMANHGDTIMVADGTYTGYGNRDVTYDGKAITIRSANGSENCIIDCGAAMEGPYHTGFLFENREGPDSVLMGFTIINAWYDYCGQYGVVVQPSDGDVPSDATIIGNVFVNNGVQLERCTCSEILDNEFKDYFAITPDGLIRVGGSFSGGDEVNVMIRGNTFQNCHEMYGLGFYGINLACSYSNGGHAIVQDNTFRDFYGSGNVINIGAAFGVAAIIKNNTFEAVECAIRIGGTSSSTADVYVHGNVLTACGTAFKMSGTGDFVGHGWFWGNKITGCGSALRVSGASNLINHASFSGNLVTGCSCAVAMVGASNSQLYADIVNNTIVNCTEGIKKGSNVQSLTIVNTILWGNGDDLVDVEESEISYSNISDGDYEGLNGNICQDPLFQAPGEGDYHLVSPGSPCIDAADNEAVLPDTFDLDGDGDTTEPIPFDFDGNPRFNDDLDTEDTGNGTPPIVDMGVYEYRLFRTIHVPSEYPTIQAGIDAAFGVMYGGDTVLVADGTYTGDGNRDIDFHGKMIAVRSENGPDSCIIDCQGTWEDPHRGFLFHSGEAQSSVLEGFTICNGNMDYAPDVSNGGAIYCYASSPTIINCMMSDNNGNSGAGVCCDAESSPAITNCTFSNNIGLIGGGIGCLDHSSPTITNCTISGNSTMDGGGGVCSCDYSCPTITNCILWGNTPDEIHVNYGADVMFNYCLIQGGWEGESNGIIDADPLFVDPDNGDYHIGAGSPCIDAANNEAVPSDTFDLDGDGDTDEPIPFDLDGRLRFADRIDTPDTGNGDPPIVDMGAYEYQCTGDLDGDGDVDLSDLAQLLANYGTTSGATYEDGDLDGDGDVDLSDLAALLAVYGTTCE